MQQYNDVELSALGMGMSLLYSSVYIVTVMCILAVNLSSNSREDDSLS